MRRWILFLIAAAILLVLPEGQRVDVGELEPMELICVRMEGEMIYVETDTGEQGGGKTLSDALRDTEDTANGKIFLETVDYLLVTEQTKAMLPEFRDILRPSVNLVMITGPVDLENMAAFLNTHKPETTMKDWLSGKKGLSKLMTAGERYYLV